MARRRGTRGDRLLARPVSALAHLLPPWIRRDERLIAQHIREGRFQRSLALLAGLSTTLAGLEVLLEHYRGSYGQRIMYSPLVLMPLLLVAGVWATASRRVARTFLPLASLLTLVDGVVGFVFHLRGVARKPGGWRLPVFNVIMGPPIFAPLLLGLSGFLGVIAALLRREDDPECAAQLASPSWLKRWPIGLPRHLAREALTVEQDVREGRFQSCRSPRRSPGWWGPPALSITRVV